MARKINIDFRTNLSFAMFVVKNVFLEEINFLTYFKYLASELLILFWLFAIRLKYILLLCDYVMEKKLRLQLCFPNHAYISYATTVFMFW